jgi:hypothetical protein
MLIDTSQRQQSYIEDCEVCCNPIQLTIRTEDLEVTNFQAESIEQ